MPDDDFNLDDILSDALGSVSEPDVPAVPEVTDKFVDDAFKALVQGYEQEEEVISTASALMEAEYIVATAEKDLEESKAEIEEIDKQEAELLRQVRELQRRRAVIKEKTFDVRQGVNKAVREKDSLVRKLEVAKQNVVMVRQKEASHEELLRRAQKFTWASGNAEGHKIFPHQMQGSEFLIAGKRCILGDGMGLGKSLTAIAALDLVESKRALVIAPADVTDNFIEEFQRWAPHRPVINIKGMSKEERNFVIANLPHLETFVIVTNYEAWRKDFSLLTRFGNLGLDTVIADEAHTIKNANTDAFKGVEDFVLTNNVCPVCPDHPIMQINDEVIKVKGANKLRKCTTCGWSGQSFDLVEDGKVLSYSERYWFTKSVKNFWAMTGTPILNSPEDLFPVLNLIDPHTFTKKNEFLSDFCIKDYSSGRWGFSPGGLHHLTNNILRGRFLARTMEDAGIILPPQRPIRHTVTLTEEQYPEQKRILKELAEHAQFVLDSGKTISAMAIIALITRQRQATVWPGGITIRDEDGNIVYQVSEEMRESIKIDKTVEIIVDLVRQGKRIALFSQFRSALEEIHNRINGADFDGTVVRSVRFDGSTTQDVKDQVRTNFNKSRGEEAKWDVVLAHYKSGGVGLNFTACEHTIILDREWNPGKEDQALARTRRIGQDKETFVHEIVVENSIDQWFDTIMEQKNNLVSGFNNAVVDIQADYLAALKKMT